jgi:transposase
VSNPMCWVGIDLHRRRSQIAIIDENGELTLSRRIGNDRDTFGELLGDPHGTHVALEATYGWEWLAELLGEVGYDVHLAHPLRTRAIAAARVKTDAVDAKTLAHLLRAGLLPEAYIAPPELRDLRELLRHRAVLTRIRTAVKNRVHALLGRQGILPEHTDLFGKAGREFRLAVRTGGVGEDDHPALGAGENLVATVAEHVAELDRRVVLRLGPVGPRVGRLRGRQRRWVAKRTQDHRAVVAVDLRPPLPQRGVELIDLNPRRASRDQLIAAVPNTSPS